MWSSKRLQAWAGIVAGVVFGVLIIAVVSHSSIVEKGESVAKKSTRRASAVQLEERVSRLRPEVSEFVESHLEWSERMELLAGLGTDLSLREQKLVEGILFHFRDSPMQAHSFNLILNLLSKQDVVNPGVADTISKLAVDSRQTELIRRYSLQQMRGVWHRTNKQGQEVIEKTLLEAVETLHSNEKGAALLSLHELSRSSQNLEKSQVNDLASRWLSDSLSNDSQKLLALRVLRENGHSQSASQVRDISTSLEQPVALRMGAVAALGELGGLEDHAFLKSLVDAGGLLAPAANRSLSLLTAK